MDKNLRKAYKIVEESTGSIDLSGLKLTCLPSNTPRVIDGRFTCSMNKLTSLKNSPKIVNGDFYCSGNNLTSLKYSPKIVTKNFWCFNNPLLNFDDLTPFIGKALCISNKFSENTIKRNALQKEKTKWMKI